jgi:Copper chaperone
MKVSLKVSGMTCANCARAIELTLKKLHGVSDVKVSFELGGVWVEFNEELLSLESIKGAIESLGYTVEREEVKQYEAYILAFCWLSGAVVMLSMFWHNPWECLFASPFGNPCAVSGWF